MCPIYEYQCQVKKCQKVIEALHKMSESLNGQKCTFCARGRIKQIVSPTPGKMAGPVYHPSMKPSEFVRRNTDHND